MTHNITIVGGGPGGYAAAIQSARSGAAVTLVDQDQVGGTCLHHGCIPSKVMKRSAELMDDLSRAWEFGIPLKGKIPIDLRQLMHRKGQIISNQVKGISAQLKQHHIRILSGTGKITTPGSVSVIDAEGTETRVHWDRLILAPGSTPIEIASLPFDGRTILSSRDALSLETLPESLLIVGGGVIGCELGTIFSLLGVDVTLVEALERLLPLPSVDEDISRVFQREMKKRKFKFHVNTKLQRVEPRSDRCIAELTPVSGKTQPQRMEVEKILICIGRRPNTSGLGLDRMGIKTDASGGIMVDDRMRTTASDVYAIGDVLGPSRWMLAHVATMEGLVAGVNATGGDRIMDYRAVPGTVFTLPEVASVGLTEKAAEKEGIAVNTHTVLFRHVGKAHVIGHIGGEAKVVVNRDTHEILGVHMVGPRVTELISEWALAINTGCTLEQIAKTIHPHPTLSEITQETALKGIGSSLYG
ncbi:MAG: dihydrolipoyl dehydrogenase [Desulfatiglandaceae bacterium]